jgi:hypothetical protein
MPPSFLLPLPLLWGKFSSSVVSQRKVNFFVKFFDFRFYRTPIFWNHVVEFPKKRLLKALDDKLYWTLLSLVEWLMCEPTLRFGSSAKISVGRIQKWREIFSRKIKIFQFHFPVRSCSCTLPSFSSPILLLLPSKYRRSLKSIIRQVALTLRDCFT